MPTETKEHEAWRLELERKALWQQRYEAAFDKLALSSPELSMSECNDRAADYATAVEDNRRLYATELERIGPEPPFSDPELEPEPGPALAPLSATMDPGMNFGGWTNPETRAY